MVVKPARHLNYELSAWPPVPIPSLGFAPSSPRGWFVLFPDGTHRTLLQPEGRRPGASA